MYMRLWSASASFVFAGMTNRSASASFASLYCPWHVRFHCMTNVSFHIIIVFLLSFFKVLGAKLTKRTIIAVHDSYCTCHLVNKNVMLKHLVGIKLWCVFDFQIFLFNSCVVLFLTSKEFLAPYMIDHWSAIMLSLLKHLWESHHWITLTWCFIFQRTTCTLALWWIIINCLQEGLTWTRLCFNKEKTKSEFS
jgi:hypothetical protein